MSYTVIGLFRDQSDAEQAKRELENSGFDTDRVDYSRYRSEGEYREHDYDYLEDESSRGFWDALFHSDADQVDDNMVETRNRYSRLGSQSNVLTVHTDDMDEAERAQAIMDTAGSINVDDYDQHLTNYRNTYADTEQDEVVSFEEYIEKNPMRDEVENDIVPTRSRIVNRKLDDEYRLRDERVYQKRNRMSDTDDEYQSGIL